MSRSEHTHMNPASSATPELGHLGHSMDGFSRSGERLQSLKPGCQRTVTELHRVVCSHFLVTCHHD